MTSTPLSICVYCGSRPGRDEAYMTAARTFGEAIATHRWRLVYGAGDVGMMGEVATAARESRAGMLGVIPVHLLNREAPQGRFSERVITETMHERKKVMLMNADAIVMLPGGAGSLDEFFEALTWRQLGLHDKPIYLLNINDFWETLQALMKHVVEQGFAENDILQTVKSVDSVDALVLELSAIQS